MNNGHRPINLLERLRQLLLYGMDAPASANNPLSPVDNNPGSNRFLFNGNLHIELAGDYQLAATEQLQAGGSLTLTVGGELENHGSLNSPQQLTLRANFIRNHVNGVINATHTRVLASEGNEGKINNRGLIDGQTTEVRAHSLNNISTGRLYGDQVMIGATTLNNYQERSGDTAAVIAARHDLTIGARRINNREHALLFSGGTMAIGGQLDPQQRLLGQAEQLNNESAIIDVQGDAHFNITTLNNSDIHFSTQEKVIHSYPMTQYQGSGSSKKWESHEVHKAYRDCLDGIDGCLDAADGSRMNDYTTYNFNRTITETQIASSDPAKLLVCGNLDLNGQGLNNDKSQVILGGTLVGSVRRINNLNDKGKQITVDQGIVK